MKQMGWVLALAFAGWLVYLHRDEVPDLLALSPNEARAPQASSSASGGVQDLSERRRQECEALGPLLEKLALLEAGFAQGISYVDFVRYQRETEAEYLRLGFMPDRVSPNMPADLCWSLDSPVPHRKGLRNVLVAIHSLLSTVRTSWYTSLELKAAGGGDEWWENHLRWAMGESRRAMRTAREAVDAHIRGDE